MLIQEQKVKNVLKNIINFYFIYWYEVDDQVFGRVHFFVNELSSFVFDKDWGWSTCRRRSN